jgi:hypothetical protein
MVHRGLRAGALSAALVAAAVAALAPSASAAGTITIEGFRAAAPPNGAPIPQPAAKPGTRMTKCQRKDAIMVIYKYKGMKASDKIKVTWYRNGKPYFLKSRAIAPDGAEGRAFRSLSPGVPNGNYKANILLNGRVAKTASVVKACPNA